MQDSSPGIEFSPLRSPIIYGMKEKTRRPRIEEIKNDPKVVSLALYRIKKGLKKEGFELVTDETGKLKLVMRKGQSS